MRLQNAAQLLQKLLAQVGLLRFRLCRRLPRPRRVSLGCGLLLRRQLRGL
jgi:hypothetical protein